MSDQNKQDEQVEIKINLANLYIDDLEVLAGFQSGGLEAMGGFLDLLDRVVEGGVRGRRLQFRLLKDIGRELMAALREAANPEDESGKN